MQIFLSPAIFLLISPAPIVEATISKELWEIFFVHTHIQIHTHPDFRRVWLVCFANRNRGTNAGSTALRWKVLRKNTKFCHLKRRLKDLVQRVWSFVWNYETVVMLKILQIPLSCSAEAYTFCIFGRTLIGRKMRRQPRYGCVLSEKKKIPLPRNPAAAARRWVETARIVCNFQPSKREHQKTLLLLVSKGCQRFRFDGRFRTGNLFALQRWEPEDGTKIIKYKQVNKAASE